MTSFKRTQRKYVQKAYRVRNWREYETGLRTRGSLTVWLGLTDGKLANWNSPRPTRRKPGRQRQYSNHAIETTVTLGLVFGLASRQTEGFLRSLLTLLNLDNDVPDHSTISRRKARLGKVASYERRTALVHESELARNDPHPEAPHLPISYDSGPPRSVIRFRMLHASSASALCPPGVRARRPVPMIDLYLKKAFSTRACRW